MDDNGTLDVRFGPHPTVHGTATGVHASNGNVLAREGSNGKTRQITYWDADYYRPFSAEDEQSYVKILADLRSLNAEKDRIRNRYKFEKGLAGTVRKAVQAATQAALADEAGNQA